MAESISVEVGKIYQNDLYHQLLEKLIQSTTPDVQFVFNGENGEVKIPAHKKLLSISSPVFNAMFNGELKENGDVAIVDASADGFKEFLQFFYSKEVKLTMENIEDVLNLAHKYDVTDCFAIAVRFLKEHLTADKMLWGLHLALKYQSDELKTFCKDRIADDLESALDAFQFHDSSGMSISTTDQMLLGTNLASLWKEVFSLRKRKICNLPMKHIVSFSSSMFDVYSHEKVSSEETIKFNPYDLSNKLWLREIHFARYYEKFGSSFRVIQLKGTLTVAKGFGLNTTVIFRTKFDSNINLTTPIYFDPSYLYHITIKPSVAGYPSKVNPLPITDMGIKNKLNISSIPKYTLIDRLCFEESPKK